jgi:hypothetical protein
MKLMGTIVMQCLMTMLMTVPLAVMTLRLMMATTVTTVTAVPVAGPRGRRASSVHAVIQLETSN